LIERLSTTIIEKECTFEILFLKRYLSAKDFQEYCREKTDLYAMRERDEDLEFERGSQRLKKIANESMAAWIRVYIQVADRTRGRDHSDRLRILQRLSIKEYVALPSVSLYIVDNEVFVTPYLYRRHCSDVPGFRIAGFDTDLYKSYYGHFKKIWDDPLTTWSLPWAFIEALAEDPRGTIDRFNAMCRSVKDEFESIKQQDPAFGSSPEYLKVEEESIARLFARNKPDTSSANAASAGKPQ
jgi:hypothetical protein